MVTMIRSKVIRTILSCFALAAAVPQAAWAQYPERPIKYIMPAGPGSAPDSLMRMLLADVSKRLGTPIIIENRTGGGGLIAMQAIVSAASDGYTIGHGNTQTLGINPGLSQVAMDLSKKVDLIVQVGYTTNILSVNPNLPVNSVKELVAYAKAHPGELKFGSAGNGTSGHVGGELFKTMTGTDMIHVPYKSAAPAVADVMAGHVDLMFDNLASSLPQVKAGKLKPLGVTSLKRTPLAPNVLTVSEAGVPGYETVSWSGLIGPKGLSPEITKKLNEAVNQSLKDPQIVANLHELGYEIVGGTAADFAVWSQREQSKWTAVIRASGAKTD